MMWTTQSVSVLHSTNASIINFSRHNSTQSNHHCIAQLFHRRYQPQSSSPETTFVVKKTDIMMMTKKSILALAAVVLSSDMPSTYAFVAPSGVTSTSSSKVLGMESLRIVENTISNMVSSSTSSTQLRMSDDDSWEASKSAMIGGAGVNNAGEPPFELRGFSLGNVVILAGVLITILSFVEYLSDSGAEGLNVSGLGFVYGIPIFVAGAALKYAEINPVPVFSTPAGERIFESKATETIKKIKQDVTRHRYGDEAHLDTTVKKLGLVVPGKAYPQLRELREEEVDGELAFMIVWQSLDTPYKMWAEERRVKKYETFFGPGVKAEVVKIDAEQRLVGIRLTTISSTPAPLSVEATTSTSA